MNEPAPRGRHRRPRGPRDEAALGDADDAVAFAYTEFTVDRAGDVEFRGAADDNFTVWVNGERVFGFEEYRNGVRLDRHRFPVPQGGQEHGARQGLPVAGANPEPNWEFFLRVVDDTGKGLAITSAGPRS